MVSPLMSLAHSPEKQALLAVSYAFSELPSNTHVFLQFSINFIKFFFNEPFLSDKDGIKGSEKLICDDIYVMVLLTRRDKTKL